MNKKAQQRYFMKWAVVTVLVLILIALKAQLNIQLAHDLQHTQPQVTAQELNYHE